MLTRSSCLFQDIAAAYKDVLAQDFLEKKATQFPAGITRQALEEMVKMEQLLQRTLRWDKLNITRNSLKKARQI